MAIDELNRLTRIERDLNEAAILSGWTTEEIREECQKESKERGCTFENALDEFKRLASVLHLTDPDEEVRLILSTHELSWWKKRWRLLEKIRKEKG